MNRPTELTPENSIKNGSRKSIFGFLGLSLALHGAPRACDAVSKYVPKEEMVAVARYTLGKLWGIFSDSERQKADLRESIRSRAESGQEINLAQFYLESEMLEGLIDPEAYQAALSAFKKEVEHYQKEKGSMTDPKLIIARMVEDQGEYRGDSSLLSNLLLKKQGNCEAREKRLSSLIQEVFPDLKIASQTVKIDGTIHTRALVQIDDAWLNTENIGRNPVPLSSDDFLGTVTYHTEDRARHYAGLQTSAKFHRPHADDSSSYSVSPTKASSSDSYLVLPLPAGIDVDEIRDEDLSNRISGHSMFGRHAKEDTEEVMEFDIYETGHMELTEDMIGIGSIPFSWEMEEMKKRPGFNPSKYTSAHFYDYQSEGFLKELDAFKGVKTLSSSQTGVSFRAILSHLPSVEALEFSFRADLASLPILNAIKKLTLGAVRCEEVSVDRMDQLPALEELEIDTYAGCDLSQLRGADKLRSLIIKGETVIHSDRREIHEKGTDLVLPDNIPNLESMELIDVTLKNPEVLPQYQELKRMVIHNRFYKPLPVDSSEWFSVPQLEELELIGDPTAIGINIGDSKKLRKLDVHGIRDIHQLQGLEMLENLILGYYSYDEDELTFARNTDFSLLAELPRLRCLTVISLFSEMKTLKRETLQEQWKSLPERMKQCSENFEGSMNYIPPPPPPQPSLPNQGL